MFPTSIIIVVCLTSYGAPG